MIKEDAERTERTSRGLRRPAPLGTVGYEPELSPNGERFIWLEARFVEFVSPPCADRARATATTDLRLVVQK